MEKLKGFVAGFIFAILLSAMTLTVFANGNLRELIFGVNVSVNGIIQEFPEDQQPFIVDNRVFLSLRGISELFGIPIYFDEETSTVHIGGRAFPTDMLIGHWQLARIVEYFQGVEDYVWDIPDFNLEMTFFADGTGFILEEGEDSFVDSFVWHVDFNILILTYADGEIVDLFLQMDENMNLVFVFDMLDTVMHYYFERVQ